MIRIWHQSVNGLNGLQWYKNFLINHAKNILPNNISVDVFGLPDDVYGTGAASDVLGNEENYKRILSPIIEVPERAKGQGFNSLLLGSFSEPYIWESRSTGHLPVASLTESSVVAAFSFVKRIGLITNHPNVVKMVKKSIHKHGYGARVIDVVSIEEPLDEYELNEIGSTGSIADSSLLNSFNKASQELIARGAELIVPAEGVLASVLVNSNVNSVNSIPILDVFSAGWFYSAFLTKFSTTLKI